MNYRFAVHPAMSLAHKLLADDIDPGQAKKNGPI
jgi:hypothetical protein